MIFRVQKLRCFDQLFRSWASKPTARWHCQVYFNREIWICIFSRHLVVKKGSKKLSAEGVYSWRHIEADPELWHDKFVHRCQLLEYKEKPGSTWKRKTGKKLTDLCTSYESPLLLLEKQAVPCLVRIVWNYRQTRTPNRFTVLGEDSQVTVKNNWRKPGWCVCK